MNKISMLWAVLLLLLMSSCKSEYDQLVKREMATGVIQDSLVFDMHFGDEKKDFFTKCWELNSQKTVGPGTGNQYARYDEPLDSTKDITKRIRMDFYGMFDENDVMRGMEMIFSYISWAPWNKERYAEPLIEHLTEKLVVDYGGNEFLKVDLKKAKKTTYVKVDGNRQIIMFTKGDKEVMVRIEDLTYKLKL